MWLKIHCEFHGLREAMLVSQSHITLWSQHDILINWLVVLSPCALIYVLYLEFKLLCLTMSG